MEIISSTQVIAAEGEQKASRALKEAAEVIQESPAALQVRKSKDLCLINYTLENRNV